MRSGNMLDLIVEYKFYILIVLVILLISIMLIIIKNKKVKPIDMNKVLDEEDELNKIEEAFNNNHPLTSFEEEQEANAIISYQELVKAVEEKKATSEFKKDEKIKKEEIESTNDIENIINMLDKSSSEKIEDIEPEEVLESIKEEPKEVIKPKFKNSEFISPIFGTQNNSKSDDFLKELKDLRKNL